jgi:hypothetical protein
MATTELTTGRRDLRRAWLSLALLPVAFLAAFGIGEGLASLLGHDPGDAGPPPVWAVLLATVPALAVFSVPGVLAWHFGGRAVAAGHPAGRAPQLVGLVLTVGFVGLNLVQYVAQLLLDGA